MQYEPVLKKIKLAVESNNAGELLNSTYHDWVLIYLQTDQIFFNSFAVDNEFRDLYDSEDILGLSFCMKESSVSCCGVNDGSHYMERAHESGLGESLLWPLFFYRPIYQDGRLTPRYELLQDFVHANGLFFDWKENTLNLINDVGDIEVKALILNEHNLKLILVEKKALDYYLGYSKQFLVRFFEFVEQGENNNWTVQNFNNGEVVRKVFQYEGISRFRGAEIIPARYSIKDIERGLSKKYETFIIQDWKHKRIVEWSCDPTMLDSYFRDSGKPFEISPVFFNPEVLSKYKNNHEKYELDDRHIHCHGAWSLNTYSINEEGQVHTYICYLGQLPHREQLHWKQYNEEPKAGISDVAYKTDFMVEFVEDEYPLKSLKRLLVDFPSLRQGDDEFVIWAPKGGDLEVLSNKLHPVITDVKKEYQDYLLNLTILIVDGLELKTLRMLTNSDEKASSLTCLEKLLKSWGSNNTTTIMDACRALQRKRSKYVGHGGGKIDFDIKSESFAITRDVENALRLLCEEIKSNSTS